MHLYMYTCMYVCMHACNACMHICMRLRHTHAQVCLYVRMFVCMYVRMWHMANTSWSCSLVSKVAAPERANALTTEDAQRCKGFRKPSEVFGGIILQYIPKLLSAHMNVSAE